MVMIGVFGRDSVETSKKGLITSTDLLVALRQGCLHPR